MLRVKRIIKYNFNYIISTCFTSILWRRLQVCLHIITYRYLLFIQQMLQILCEIFLLLKLLNYFEFGTSKDSKAFFTQINNLQFFNKS